MQKYIFHITHLKNLKSIIKQGGLWCDTEMLRQDITFKSIAHQTLKDGRTLTLVPLDPGGHLCDYVPFYFAPRSPMLYAISKGYVEGYLEGQESVVYLVSTAESVEKAGLPFVFTDGHGIMAITDFFHDLKDLKNVDWDIMKEKYWNDTDEDPDRKRRRQAEFLVHQFFPWNLLMGIGVFNAMKEKEVNKILSGVKHVPQVKILRSWYYL